MGKCVEQNRTEQNSKKAKTHRTPNKFQMQFKFSNGMQKFSTSFWVQKIISKIQGEGGGGELGAWRILGTWVCKLKFCFDLLRDLSCCTSLPAKRWSPEEEQEWAELSHNHPHREGVRMRAERAEGSSTWKLELAKRRKQFAIHICITSAFQPQTYPLSTHSLTLTHLLLKKQ